MITNHALVSFLRLLADTLERAPILPERAAETRSASMPPPAASLLQPGQLLVSIPKAAAFLGVSDTTLRNRLARDRELARAVLDESGGAQYVKMPALLRWLENDHRGQPTRTLPERRGLRRVV